MQPHPAVTVQANQASIQTQIANAGTDLDRVTSLSQTAFPVRTSTFLGITTHELPIQIRWPTANTVGRNTVSFKLNFVMIQKQQWRLCRTIEKPGALEGMATLPSSALVVMLPQRCWSRKIERYAAHGPTALEYRFAKVRATCAR